MDAAGSKIDLGALQDTIFEKHQISDGPGGAQNWPRGAQEHLKDVPDRPKPLANHFQMEPKTLPNLLLKYFFRSFFPTRNLHRFFIDFSLLSCCLSKGPPLQNTVKT